MSNCNYNQSESETPTLVWLDANAYKEEGKATRTTLRDTLGDVMAFEDKSEFSRYFGRDLSKKRIILIISGQIGKEFVPTIHGSAGILSIYIYCGNKSFHETWAKDYSKIKMVCTSLDELVSEIFSDPCIL